MCLICRGENLEGLTEIDCHGCPNLIVLPLLPASLIRLYCFSCPKLVNLPELPASLIQLYCAGCPRLTSLLVLPASLTHLYCSNCPNFTSLPLLPASLIYLECTGCPRIVSLPILPISLLHLYCENRWLTIKHIGVLNHDYPENIRKLSIVQGMIKKHYLRHKFSIRTTLKKYTVIPMAIIDSICREYL